MPIYRWLVIYLRSRFEYLLSRIRNWPTTTCDQILPTYYHASNEVHMSVNGGISVVYSMSNEAV